jgi:hypothetical protein
MCDTSHINQWLAILRGSFLAHPLRFGAHDCLQRFVAVPHLKQLSVDVGVDEFTGAVFADAELVTMVRPFMSYEHDIVFA